MQVQAERRENRSAIIKYEDDERVLYDAMEGNKVIYPNMHIRASNFWDEYSPLR